MKDYPFLRKALFTTEEASLSFNDPKSMYAFLERKVKKGELVKLKKGLYARLSPLDGGIFVNRYEIATALHEGNYVAYHSALEYHGLATQVYSDVHIVNKSNYSPIVIDGLEYQFFHNEYQEGIMSINRYAPIRVTELERTLVDVVDRILLSGGLEEVYMAFSMINYLHEEKLLYHLSHYGKKVLYKKIGFLFSLIKPAYLSPSFYEECHANISHAKDYIGDANTLTYIYDPFWMIYYPKEIINQEN